MGWGITSTNTGKLSDTIFMEVSVNVISNKKWNGGDSYDGQITENVLCTMDKKEDSCQGDSGGPLMLCIDLW